MLHTSPVLGSRSRVGFVGLVLVVLSGSVCGADGFGRKTLQRQSRSVRLQYTLPAPEVRQQTAPDGRVFSELKLPGAGHSAEVGRPDLPTLVEDIRIAPRGEVSVRILPQGKSRLTTAHWVYPVQEAVPKLPGARERRRFAIDEGWYRGGGKGRAAAGVPFTATTYVVRGQRFVRVVLSPYAYDPVSQEVSYPPALSLNVTVAAPTLPAAAGPRLGPVLVLRVPLRSRDDLAVLEALGADVKTVRDAEAIVYATEAERLDFEKAGLAADLLEVQTPDPEGAGARAISAGYHDWAQVQALMTGFATSHPTLCRLETIGTSGGGRPLLALCISDNPGSEEAEPEVRVGGAIHGDEVLGTEMSLLFIDHLLSGYATDSRLQTLVDSTEIWVVPVMNPDGFVAGTRYNAGGVDLNRSFPDGAVDPIGNVFTGPAMDTAGRPAETVAMMQWSAAHSFVLSATFHTGALVANYPYDNDGKGSVYSPTTDEGEFVWLAETYSSRNPPMWASAQFPHGITNGAAWYTIEGGIQDWLYRYLGCLDITFEISNSDRPAASTLATLWDNNRESMLAYCEAACTGIRGIVTDSGKGGPLRASIAVQGRTSPVFSDPDLGDYYRLLRPGTYTVTVSAPGYGSRTLSGIVVGAGNATVVDVGLEASATGGGVPLVVVHHADHDSAFAAYLARKQTEGYAVTEVRLTGTPTAESVRDQVRDAYAGTAATHVVILGDVDRVPTFTNTADGTTARSDLAYALLDPGETFDDFLGKDVGIGRISLDTNEQLNDYTAKLAAFNSTDRHRDLTWVSGGSSTWEWDVAEGTHNYVIENYLASASYHHELFYRSNGTAAELSAHIDAGTDAVVYSGHGSETGWLRYGYDGADLAGLSNALDAPVVFGHCCLTGRFELPECFAEEWLATQARGVVYVGGSHNTLWDEDDVLERREFQYFHENAGSTVAEALDWGLRQTAAAYPRTAEYYFTVYHVFGDPTTRLFGVPFLVAHTPLEDTADRTGPYTVEATVSSLTVPRSVVLYWRVAAGGPFAAVPMAWSSGTTYRALVPGQPYGSEVQYYILATSETGAIAAHPADAPTSWNAFRVDVLFAHTPLGNTADTDGPYTVRAEVTADGAVTVALNWRVGAGAYTTVPMAGEGSTYSAAILGQPGGTLVSYYLTATAGGYVAYEPVDAPAQVHQFLVDTQPPAFAGLESALAGDQAVTLAWSAAADSSAPVTYSIFRGASAGGQDFGSPLATTEELTYTDTGLSNGTEYFYVVRAADAVGNAEANRSERAATPVGPVPIYAWPLDSDPGWRRDTDWAYGAPLGLGGEFGNPDPEAAATGAAVFGYNLAGDYENSMTARYLTAGPIDCSAITGTSLRFQRWLNVEGPSFDLATIEVSPDGSDWRPVWENPAEIADSAWVPQTCDISPAADGCATVYVRWGMGPTDEGWRFSGWNLDDIQIWGIPATPPGFRLTLASVPPAGGSVAAEPAPNGSGRYAEGTVVTLSPVPAEGFTFTGWSGDAGGSAVPLEVAMVADRAVAAHFVSGDITAPVFAGLTAAAPGDGSVTLSWAPATDESLPIVYEVHRAETAGGQTFEAPHGTTQGTSYTDYAVSDGVTYYYVVRAVDAAGNRDANLVELAATPQGPERAHAWSLDTDPGWALGKSWAFGLPRGKGGREGGFPDPLRGHTGSSVLGYNLKGDYKNRMKVPSYLTTAAFDCSLLSATEVRYRRWLNVERLPADRAAIEVSTDGRTWHTVWQNDSTILDSSWQAQRVSIAAYADGSATVRVRWVMGPTNKVLRMSGWNLDDIEIWGIRAPQGSRGSAEQRASAAAADPGGGASPNALSDTASAWSWPIRLAGGVNTTLCFGTAPAAQALAAASGLTAPAAWLIGPDGTPCTQVLAPVGQPAEWFLDVLPPTVLPVRLTWAEPPGIPADHFVALVEVDAAGDVVPDGLAADLRRESALTVPPGTPRRLRLRYAPEVAWELALEAGWNPVSLPLDPALPAAATVFADSASAVARALPALRYDPVADAYTAADLVRPCEGYWVYSSAPLRLLVSGAAFDDASLTLAAGWNLVGVPWGLSAPPATAQGVGPWLACAAADSAPLPAGTLIPGTAYWVFSPVPLALSFGDLR